MPTMMYVVFIIVESTHLVHKFHRKMTVQIIHNHDNLSLIEQ